MRSFDIEFMLRLMSKVGLSKLFNIVTMVTILKIEKVLVVPSYLVSRETYF